MSYPRIHEKIFGEPWLVAPDTYDAIRRTFLAHVAAKSSADPESLRPEIPALDPHAAAFFAAGPSRGREKLYHQIGATAVLGFSGIIGKRLGWLETFCGGLDVDQMTGILSSAYADDSVESIILHLDTPGGTVTGVPEAAYYLASLAAQGEKEIVAYTDTLMASAGYYIAAGAHRIVASPSSRVGSIGVVGTLLDCTQFDAIEGLKYTTYKSGKYKDLGNPHREATPEESAKIQAEVDAIAAEFFARVRQYRPEAQEEVFAADVYRGSEALRVGLVDALASSLEELLEQLA